MEISDKEKQSMIDDFIAAYNAFDVDTMVSFVHPKIIFENVVGGETNARATGIDEFRAMAEQSKSFFSYRCQYIKSYAFDGDKVAVDIDYEAVLAIDLPNGMKAGETLQLNGRSEFAFKDGKLYKITDYS